MKKLLSFALAALMLLCLLPATHAAAEPAESYNNNIQTYHCGAMVEFGYGRYVLACHANPIRSYLYADGDNLCRVEYTNGYQWRLVVETYSPSHTLLTQKELSLELPLFGGFYAGTDANYLVFGQENPAEDDAREVIRVVRYSKDWKRLDSVSFFGENTYDPFEGGSLRMTEDDTFLYVLTCHTMYASGDGRNHQANMFFAIRKSDMAVMSGRSSISNISTGYVSHSFNQFIVKDGDWLVTLDHGDAYPRAAVLSRCQVVREGDQYSSQSRSYLNLMSFPGKSGDNTTGASLGGLVMTPTHYIAAGISVDQSLPDVNQGGGQRNVFICAVPKGNFTDESVKTRWLTSYRADAENRTIVSTPQLVSLSDGRALVLWTVGDTLYYQFLKADGTPDGSVRSGLGALSDCAPVEIEGKVQWYVTFRSAPEFYAVGLDGTLTVSHEWDGGIVTKQPTETEEGIKTYSCALCQKTRTESIPKRKLAEGSPFKDVYQNTFYAPAVVWAVQKGITNGTSATTFSPDDSCTRGQVVTFLWRANGSPEPKSTNNPFTDVKKGTYYYKAVLWANENNITNGTGAKTFSPESPCTRAHVVTFLWRTANKPAAGSSNPFKDVPAGQYFTDAVLWAVNHNPQITNGTGADTFSPDNPCTRGQIVTFLYRYMK